MASSVNSAAKLSDVLMQGLFLSNCRKKINYDCWTGTDDVQYRKPWDETGFIDDILKTPKEDGDSKHKPADLLHVHFSAMM